MITNVPKLIRAALQGARMEMKRVRAETSRRGRFSHLDEEAVIRRQLETLGVDLGYCVDIAAADGLRMSNTYSLFRAGWRGLCVEFDPDAFASLARTYSSFSGVNLARCMVTPPNVVDLLKANGVPEDFELLNLDIDGYDHFVLERLLTQYRPRLICAEINEKIPPPIKFTVRWDPDYVWSEDHFFGQSLSLLHELATGNEYSLVELHYNNAFLVANECRPAASLSAEEAYREGYASRPDRKERFPWNDDMEALQTLEPAEALEFVNQYFSRYAGQYDARI